MLDGNELVGRSLNSLVDDSKASTSQLFKHLIVVGHCGFVEGRRHGCLESVIATLEKATGVLHTREKVGIGLL